MRGGLRTGWAAILVALAAAAPGAAQPVDPEWPCIQPKVPELSIGQMWSGPIPDHGKPDRDMRELARNLAPRRVSVDDVTASAEARLQDIAPEDRPAWLADLFAAILERINSERSQVMAGIGRYADRQETMSERVDATEAEIVTLQQAPEAERDAERLKQLQDAVAWQTRIFKERSQSLTYVCEAPVLLEKRAFAIGRALAGLS